MVFLYPFLGNAMKKYTVDKDADVMAPGWLSVRIDYINIKFVYYNVDGAVRLKGVKIGSEVAEIGDTILFNGRRLSVERR